MTATTFYDQDSHTSACFIDGEDDQRRRDWLDAHPNAVMTGTGTVSAALAEKMKKEWPCIDQATAIEWRNTARVAAAIDEGNGYRCSACGYFHREELDNAVPLACENCGSVIAGAVKP